MRLNYKILKHSIIEILFQFKYLDCQKFIQFIFNTWSSRKVFAFYKYVTVNVNINDVKMDFLEYFIYLPKNSNEKQILIWIKFIYHDVFPKLED